MVGQVLPGHQLIVALRKLARSVIAAAALATASSAEATDYYFAQDGSNSNACTSVSPCLTTGGHATAGGDRWIMLSGHGAYHLGTSSLFPGAVSGGSLTSMAELTCDVPLACSLDNTAANLGVIALSNSYWKVDGFTLAATGAECIVMQPFSAADIQGFVITNNYCTGAVTGGIATVPFTGSGASNGADNITISRNVVYNGAVSGVACNSFYDLFAPKNFNGGAGGTITVAFNAAFGPSPALSTACPSNSGGGSSDRNGLLIDRDDGSTSNGRPYTGTYVVLGNIFAGVGGSGIKAFHSVLARKIVAGNTLWHNLADTNYGDSTCAELRASLSSNTLWFNNVSVPNAGSIPSGCSGKVYAIADDGNGGGPVQDQENFDQLYSSAGTNALLSGFALGASAVTGQNPALFNPTVPTSAINCAGLGYTDVMACYGAVLAGFRATNLRNGQGA